MEIPRNHLDCGASNFTCQKFISLKIVVHVLFAIKSFPKRLGANACCPSPKCYHMNSHKRSPKRVKDHHKSSGGFKLPNLIQRLPEGHLYLSNFGIRRAVIKQISKLRQVCCCPAQRRQQRLVLQIQTIRFRYQSGDFVMKVKQINSRSDLISTSMSIYLFICLQSSLH